MALRMRSRVASDSGITGSRHSSLQKPSREAAYLAPAGLGSANIA